MGIWHKIGTASVLALSACLLSLPGAWANGVFEDDPPPNTHGRSGGSRGCATTATVSLDDPPALVLLTSEQGLTQTVSRRPTFAWFVRDPGSWQMKFRLYQYDPVTEAAKLMTEIKDSHFRSVSGIMVLSLSEMIPALEIGQRYLWQVELICDPNRPSSNLFAEAEIEVVEQPDQIVGVVDANAYAEVELWHDAMAAALTPMGVVFKQEPLTSVMVALLDQVAIDEVEREQLGQSQIHLLQR
ncbi:MAG: DUF928 domain-containing protein [Cyanothece sp. SIO1E1]|nr:DUF928 domain-containing protein [Cyanothece sp. SIO1E1]